MKRLFAAFLAKQEEEPVQNFLIHLLQTAAWIGFVIFTLAIVGVLAIVKAIMNAVHAIQHTAQDGIVRGSEIIHGDFGSDATTAAQALAAQFHGQPWYLTTGVDGNAIIVYARTEPPVGVIPNDKSGHPVTYRVIGDISAA